MDSLHESLGRAAGILAGVIRRRNAASPLALVVGGLARLVGAVRDAGFRRIAAHHLARAVLVLAVRTALAHDLCVESSIPLFARFRFLDVLVHRRLSLAGLGLFALAARRRFALGLRLGRE